MEQPVNVGDRMFVVIDGIGTQGDPFVRIKGLLVFIPHAKPNQQYDIVITKVMSKCAIARIEHG